MITPKKFTAEVVTNTKESNKVYITRFRAENFFYLAGQYASFILAPTVRRSLSFASPPNNDEFETCLDVTPKGPISTWIERAKPGDSIEFLGPLGRFVVDTESARHKIFVATGTGIGPIRAMVHDELRKNRDPIKLYWGLRFEHDEFWHDEFLTLAKSNPHFSYALTISKPSIEWKGVDGRVTDHLFQQEEPLANYDFYLCGSREMVNDVTAQLVSKNVPHEQIKTELFY